jgi:uncharacterized protein YecT (DUF1311 family)
MMGRLILALAGGLAILPAVLPAQALKVDENIIMGCFLATQTGAAARSEQCAGEAANQCQSLPGGSTTIGITECIGAETAVWDRFLNTQYQVAREHLFAVGGEDLQISLRDAQRAWIAFRDAECALQYDRYAGGTIRSVVYASCMMTMTATRAVALGKIGTGMQ